jgi:FlgD Ig-like domain/Periplasmic copper-binding protein (NosD)
MIGRAVTILAVMLCVTVCGASTYTVTTTADSGAGSLRDAIQQVNANAGADTITFAGALSGQTIKPTASLPDVTGDYTTIDGDLNDDGAPDIFLSGELFEHSGNGLWLLGSDHSTVRGLAIGNCTSAGIHLDSSRYCVIAGCHIGVNLAGDAVARNQLGDIVLNTADNNTIGGTTAADRNIIAGGKGYETAGIDIRGSQDTVVEGNYIGLARDGTALPRGHWGISITDSSEHSQGISIGRAVAGGGNVIASVLTGVQVLGASGTAIQGNLFGLEADGETLATLDNYCVMIREGATDTTIGNGTALGRNVFAGHAMTGVQLFDAETEGTTIQGNYFGTNQAGTEKRRLHCGVNLYGCGPQTVGGPSAAKGNYFCPSLKGGVAVGVEAYNTSGDAVRNNRFGLLPAGGAASGVTYGVNTYGGSELSITENTFAHVEAAGIQLGGAGTIGEVYRNRFRDCSCAVLMRVQARGRLGNLGNARTDDDGGNHFSNDLWFIRNETANSVKAEGNDFDTTSRAAIAAKIWDKADDPALGRVDFVPFVGGEAAGLAIAGATALPTRAGAEIAFSLSAPATVDVRVLNMAGRQVAEPAAAVESAAGLNRIVWTGQTATGTAAPAGRYLVQVTARTAEGQTARALCPLSLR